MPGELLLELAGGACAAGAECWLAGPCSSARSQGWVLVQLICVRLCWPSLPLQLLKLRQMISSGDLVVVLSDLREPNTPSIDAIRSVQVRRVP